MINKPATLPTKTATNNNMNENPLVLELIYKNKNISVVKVNDA